MIHAQLLGLHGAINVVSKPEQVPEMSELEKLFPEVELGGRYRPPHCTSRHRVALIVPFRDREDHLRTFLFNLHTLLPRQQLGYILFPYKYYKYEIIKLRDLWRKCNALKSF